MNAGTTANPTGAWLLGAMAGVVALIIFLLFAGYSFGPGLILATLIGVLSGLLAWVGYFRDIADDTDDGFGADDIGTIAPVSAPEHASETRATEPGAPAGLDRPRRGRPDDLKKIKGIGPKLEKSLNEMGYFHFAQIAGWSEAEVAWMDQNLKGFTGRVSRDDWVRQAGELAAPTGDRG